MNLCRPAFLSCGHAATVQRRWLTGLCCIVLLGAAAAADAESPRLHSGSLSHVGRASHRSGLHHAVPHAVALRDVALLEPGVVPEPDAPLPVEGKRYSLHLNAMHRDDSIDVVYRIGDTYVPQALTQLNEFLRDHRTDEPTEYDPKEFDLLYNLMAKLGKPTGTVDIVCGYRSPETNALLREESAGVAEHSQHIEGRAIDIRVPGVQTTTLRNAALSLGAGGVGYYPRSQFVHVDVGPVRTWTFPMRSTRVGARRRAHGKPRKRRS